MAAAPPTVSLASRLNVPATAKVPLSGLASNRGGGGGGGGAMRTLILTLVVTQSVLTPTAPGWQRPYTATAVPSAWRALPVRTPAPLMITPLGKLLLINWNCALLPCTARAPPTVSLASRFNVPATARVPLSGMASKVGARATTVKVAVLVTQCPPDGMHML